MHCCMGKEPAPPKMSSPFSFEEPQPFDGPVSAQPQRPARHYFRRLMCVRGWPLAPGNGRKEWTKYPAQIEKSIAYQVIAKR